MIVGSRVRITHRLSLGFALFTLLCGVYLLSYRGHPLSIDEYSIFDSITGIVHHGTLSRTIEFYRTPEIVTDSPYLKPLYEPLQIVAAAPFYWLANRLPAIGQFQTVLMLNVLVTALTAVSLYFIATFHKYSLRTAWLGALIFGVATLALPYSRWLFREPLMAFFTLWAFHFALTIRQRLQEKQPVYVQIGLLIGAILGIMLTKQVGILFIPGIVLCLLPNFRMIRQVAPVLLLLGGFILLFLLALTIINPDFGDDRYSITRWLNVANFGWQHIWESLLGYQISPARSFWLYSPVLLVGFIGAVMLIRRGQAPFVISVILMLLLTSAAYGALRLGSYWNGGWSWGPRYMLPIIPLWMLLVLPVIDYIVSRRDTLLRTAFGALVVVSTFMQLVGIAVPYTDFYNIIDQQREAMGIADYVAWSPDNWVWSESSIPYHLNNLRLDQLDTAWRFADPALLPILIFVLMVAASLAATLYLLRNTESVNRRWLYCLALAALIIPVIAAGIGLKSLQYDRRYIGNRQDVFELIQRMNLTVRKDSIVLINGSEYMPMFMNWFKTGSLFITLPYPMREVYAAGEAPLTPEERYSLLGAETISVIDWAAKTTDRIWVVMQSGPFIQDAIRPLEYYMAMHLFPVREITVSQQARAISFATSQQALTPINVPENDELTPEVSISGTTFKPGDTILIDLTWTPLQLIEQDYQISIQLIDETGTLKVQRDSIPQGTFGLTSQWQVGEQYRDHHALRLLDTLPPGVYTLQIVIYDLQDELNPAVHATIPVTEITIEK